MLYVHLFWEWTSLLGWIAVPFAAWRHNHLMKRKSGRRVTKPPPPKGSLPWSMT